MRAPYPAFWRAAALAVFLVAGWQVLPAQDRALRIVAFGDSLTAGYGLIESEAFPARLEAALRARGLDVAVVNAGVSGDTSRGGLERLDWTLAENPDLMIVELGANDALRGIHPAETRANLAAILGRLKDRGIPTLLAGMRAPPNLGEDYGREYEAIFPELAEEYGAELYPFFLEGVAADPRLNLQDGMHPNAAGVERIVEGIVGPVAGMIARLRD